MADPTYIPPPKEVKISYITSVHPIWAFLLGVVVSGAAVYQVQKEIAAIDFATTNLKGNFKPCQNTAQNTMPAHTASEGLCQKLNEAATPDHFGKYFAAYLAGLPNTELIVASPLVVENILSLTRCAEIIDTPEEVRRFQQNLRSAYLGHAYNSKKDKDPFRFPVELGQGKVPVFRFRH